VKRKIRIDDHNDTIKSKSAPQANVEGAALAAASSWPKKKRISIRYTLIAGTANQPPSLL
jgi:hypothetical protein